MHNSIMSVQNQMKTIVPFQYIKALKFGTMNVMATLDFRALLLWSCSVGSLASRGYHCIQNLPNSNVNALLI